MKKNVIIFIIASFIISSFSVSYAIDPKIPEGILASIEGYGTSKDFDNNSIKMDFNETSSNQFISITNSTLQDMGNQTVSITASTRTISIVDTLNLKVYLERWTGSTWSVINSWSDSDSRTNVHNFNTLHSVISGDYYRVRATHTVINDGITENENTLTSYILIK